VNLKPEFSVHSSFLCITVDDHRHDSVVYDVNHLIAADYQMISIPVIADGAGKRFAITERGDYPCGFGRLLDISELTRKRLKSKSVRILPQVLMSFVADQRIED
jgi:hypothetical protein